MKLKPLSYLDIKVNMFITKLRVRKQSKENLENLTQSSIKLELVGEKEFNLFLINDDHCASILSLIGLSNF